MPKWIKLSEGKYKLVEDDDPRPEDLEFKNRPRPEGIPYVLNKPPWLPNADLQKVSTDGAISQKYTEAVTSEAKKWSSSGHWANMEKGRKDYIKSQKQEWIKRGAKPQDREEIMK